MSDEQPQQLRRGTITAPRLPGSLASEFGAVRVLRDDDHATVTIIRHRVTQQFKVVKVYRAAEIPDDNPSSPKADPRCVLPVERSVQDVSGEARLVELMDYLSHGSVSDVLQTTPGRGRTVLARDLLVQVTAALEHLHNDLGVAHRAIHVHNVLFHSVTPTISVLAHSGVAAWHEDRLRFEGHFSVDGPKRAYRAPETLDTTNVEPAQDWWALGILVFEILVGRQPFTSDSREFSAGTLDLSGLPDRRWNPLIRGLLEHQTAHRWGAEEIREWCRGGSPDVVGVARMPRTISRSSAPYVFAGKHVTDPSSLAIAMRENWVAATRVFTDAGQCEELRTWIRRDIRDNQISLDRLTTAAGREAVDSRIIEFTSHYLGSLDPQLHGEPATAGTLADRFMRVGANWISDKPLSALTPRVASSLANAQYNNRVRRGLQHPDFTAFTRYAKYVTDGDHLITGVFSRFPDVSPDREILETQAILRAALLSDEIAADASHAFPVVPQQDSGGEADLHHAAASAEGPTKTILEVLYQQTQAFSDRDDVVLPPVRDLLEAAAPATARARKSSPFRRPQRRTIAVAAAAILIGIGGVSFLGSRPDSASQDIASQDGARAEAVKSPQTQGVSDVPALVEPPVCGTSRTVTITDAVSGAVLNTWTLTREVADAGTAICNRVTLYRDSQPMSALVLPPGVAYVDGEEGLWTYLDGAEAIPTDQAVSATDLPHAWLIARTTDGRAISANLSEPVLAL